MRRIIGICMFLVIIMHVDVFGQSTDTLDVVYLKSGRVVKGHIIERIPNIEIKLKSLDGSMIIYSYKDFTELKREVASQAVAKIQYQDSPYLLIKKRIRKKTMKIQYEKFGFASSGISMHPSQYSEFIMLGKVKNNGEYIKIKSNLNFDLGYDYSGFANTNRYFNGDVFKGRYSITGGLLWRISKPLVLYTGGGYGSRWVNWGTISNSTFRVDDISYTGLELETGLMFKMKRLVFVGGVCTNQLKYMEFDLGLGFNF